MESQHSIGDASSSTLVKSLTSEGEEVKICQDKIDSEKIITFSSRAGSGGDSGHSRGGVSITFSDQSRGDSSSDHLDHHDQQECIQAQLAAVKLKLEQKRKKIEDEKKKMEMFMTKQREIVGQEAFLRAVGNFPSLRELLTISNIMFSRALCRNPMEKTMAF